MKKKFIDPLIKRKANLTKKIQYYNNVPLPSVIEISESGTCNRKCSFCPRSAPDFKDVKEFISEDHNKYITFTEADLQSTSLKIKNKDL